MAKYVAKNWIYRFVGPIAHPTLFVSKKGTEELRWCVDYGRLNKVTEDMAVTLPDIRELRTKLAQAHWFTKIDLDTAFHQILVHPDDQPLLAFIVDGIQYTWRAMPMGIKNAPEHFQRFMAKVLEGILMDFVLDFIDDLLVFTVGSLAEHLRQIEEVLKRLAQYGLKAKFRKCYWLKNEIEFLGMIVGGGQLKTTDETRNKIHMWPVPTNVKQLRGFLGMSGWVRDFVPKFAEQAAPLYELLKKGAKFDITPIHLESIQSIKNACIENMSLYNFDLELPTRIESDYSLKNNTGGAVLLQKRNGRWVPSQFYSFTATPAERKYPIGELEFLALVKALKH